MGNWLGMAAALAATAAVVALLATVACRIFYPYELEWMEGGILDHIQRLRAGEPIYVEPTFSFVPFIYPPLYYCLSAMVMELLGEGFLGPRLVSVAATAATLGLICRWVRVETGRPLPAICAAGLYAAGYPLVDGWFDVARIDALLPLLLLGAAYWIRRGHRLGSALVAGLLLTCAFLTKQSALVFAAPLLAFQWWHHRRRFAALLTAAALPSVLVSAWLHWHSGGWYGYYVFWLPHQHGWVPPQHWFDLWSSDLFPQLAPTLLLVAAMAVMRFRTRRLGAAWDFYACLTLGAVAIAWLSRLHEGGGVNVIVPMLATLAVLFGLATAQLPTSIRLGKHATAEARPRCQAVVAGLGLLQLLVLLVNFHPSQWIPSEADRRAGDELLARIEQFSGEVLVPSAPYLAARAGKSTMAHQMALADVFRAAGNTDIRQKLAADVNRRLRDPRNDAIILFCRSGWFQDTPIRAEYMFAGKIFRSDQRFRPRSGAKGFAPVYLFVRRGPRPPSQQAEIVSAP